MRYHTSKSYVKTKTLNQDLTVHNRINTVLNTCICTCPKIFMQHIFLIKSFNIQKYLWDKMIFIYLNEKNLKISPSKHGQTPPLFCHAD